MQLHRHRTAYAAIVLEGEYVEASADGVWRCQPGAVLLHPPLHAHANWFSASAARVLNVPLATMSSPLQNLEARRITDLMLPGRLGRRGLAHLLEAAIDSSLLEALPLPHDVSQLAEVLGTSAKSPVTKVAQRLGVSREHLSRRFHTHFGMSPREYRAERRLHHALALLRRSSRQLSAVSLETGFSDQPHLTRAMKRAIGMTPGQARCELQPSIGDG